MFTQSVKNRLIAQAEQAVRDAQAAVTFAQNLPVGSSTDIARSVRLNKAFATNSVKEVPLKKKGRRRLTASARKRISEAMKARWARVKRAQKAA